MTIVALVHVRGAQAASYPDEYALRPLQLPGGLTGLRVPVVFNLSKGAVGKPVFIPLEVRVGMSDELELRIFHPGHGICLTGKSKGCDHPYNDVGLGLLYSLSRAADMDVAFLGALELNSLTTPIISHLDVGIAFKYISAPISIAVTPYFAVALTHREASGDSINIPAELAFQINALTALFVESGIYGDAHHLGDSWSMPLGIGINELLSHGVDLGAELKFNRAIGNGSGSADRVGIVYIAARF